MLAKVRKSIVSNGRVLVPGEVVDISTWRNARSLVNARYVELVESAPAPAPVSIEAEEVEVKEKTAKPKTKK